MRSLLHPAVNARGRGAFAAGNYAGVVALREPMRQEFTRMGDSGAQRQVLADTLAAARARVAAG
jgi:hypothetical protein